MRDLSSLNLQQLKDFFDSFDQILCDVHGVLINILDEIPGAAEAVKTLQNLGKRVIVVSNNTLVTVEEYQEELKSSGFDISLENIVTPCLPVISFLKKQNLSKQIFVLGSHALKSSLEAAGFQIAPRGPLEIGDTYEDMAAFTEDDGSVGAVLADIDLNLNYLNLQKALTLLKRDDVVFLKGTADMKFSLGAGHTVMGVGVFYKILEELSGREPLSMAKPGPGLNEYLVERYQIRDPGRVLFIGDSVPSDMGFASQFGYQKLLVLSGLTKEKSVKNWKFANELKPDFYVDSLKTVNDLVLGIL